MTSSVQAGRAADGVEDEGRRRAVLQGIRHLAIAILVLGGLCHHEERAFDLEAREVFDAPHHMNRSFCVTLKPNDFRVVLVADDEARIPLFGVIADDRLDPCDLGTGGIQNLHPGFTQILAVLEAGCHVPE